jgi:hypothetical protein
VAVIDGLAVGLIVGLVVCGAGVPLELLLVPELHAASNAAPPAITIAARNRTGLAFDCVVMIHMLPVRGQLNVTLDGRDQFWRNAWNMLACQTYPVCH